MSFINKAIIVVSVWCFLTNPIKAQNYAVNNIPDSLLKKANAVIRDESMHLIIKDANSAILQMKIVVTVLNEEGAKEGTFNEYYNNLVELNSIEGTLYDALGNKIKSIKKKDIQDFSADGEESLITDNRYKIHNFYWSQYPYTVEYKYEKELKSLFLLPDWNPASYNVSIQHSQLTIDAPINYTVRMKGINLPTVLPSMQDNAKTKTLNYSIANYKAEDREPLSSIGLLNSFPKIVIAPSDLTMGKYTGTMNDWKQFGLFVYSLYKDKSRLPDNVKQDVHRLTDQLKTNREKAEALYKYLQNNTRYISVQLGIGGWEPFDATYVANKKYGDCKALSNYMYSLLKEANVPSYPVLISAGGNQTQYFIEDFANNYFNHAILCVPQPKDTIWLECTSQNAPFGYLSSFTANRKCLLIGPDGGFVAHTPNYSAITNLQKREVSATIDPDGNLKAKMSTFYQGEQQDYIFDMLHNASKDLLKKYLNRSLELDTYEVSSYNYKENPSSVPSVEENLDVIANNYASIVGKRIMFAPNAFNKSMTKLDATEKRRSDIVFTYPFTDYDSTALAIPENYEIENMPSSLSINSVFGNYNISFTYKEGKVLCTRRLERQAGVFPASQYDALITYFDKIYKADRERVVLKKKAN